MIAAAPRVRCCGDHVNPMGLGSAMGQAPTTGMFAVVPRPDTVLDQPPNP